MEPVTDYLKLWREIAEKQKNTKWRENTGSNDAWQDRARQFHESVQKRWERPDSSRRFLIRYLQQHPDSTVLDIGAGSGAWTCLLAPYAAHVTALDPSPAMIGFLRESLADMKIENVTVVEGSWPDVAVEPHDVALCSHSLYGHPDFERCVRAMETSCRRLCVLLLRAPVPGGIMAQIARAAWNQPYDSTNFQIAYNALLQMGIFANVSAEDTGLWEPWTSPSLADAAAAVRSKMGLAQGGKLDEFAQELLKRHLVEEDGMYIWPRGVRTMLVYWEPLKA